MMDSNDILQIEKRRATTRIIATSILCVTAVILGSILSYHLKGLWAMRMGYQEVQSAPSPSCSYMWQKTK